MPKTIEMELSPAGVASALRELFEYKKWVEKKTEQLQTMLSQIGMNTASIQFAQAVYDGTNDVEVTVNKRDNGSWEIRAHGDAVCFIEFGAGVYYNGGGVYPNPLPAGIVGIGEYGHRLGQFETWHYTNAAGETVYTHGNEAYTPMYDASQEMQRQLTKIAQEVFGS